MNNKLDEILNAVKKTISDIRTIYYGKDNACRCGCCGTYVYPGNVGFTRRINKMKNPNFSPITDVINPEFDGCKKNYGWCFC